MMEQPMRITQLMINLQRAAIDDMIDGTLNLWDSTDKMIGSFLEKFLWLPVSGREFFREWVNGNKRGFITLRNAMDDGFNSLECCFMERSGLEAPKTALAQTFPPLPVESWKPQVSSEVLVLLEKPVSHEIAAETAEASPEQEAPHEEKVEKHETEHFQPWTTQGH